MPTEPPPQPASLPWEGNITIEEPAFFNLGRHCLGQNYHPELNFEKAPHCPQVGIRTHNLTWNPALQEGWAKVQLLIEGPAPNDTLWLDITLSYKVLYVSIRTEFLIS